MKVGTRESCSCHKCRAACKLKPGWFKPGEAEKAADHLGLSLQEFFNQYLMVDWWEDSPDNIYLLSPATSKVSPGGMCGGNPRGRCVLLTDDERCLIHDVKPFECRNMWCKNHPDSGHHCHEEAAMSWDGQEHQELIAQLLGEPPVAEDFTLFDALDLWD